MFKTRIVTLLILVVWPVAIAVAASTVMAQDRVKPRKVAEVGIPGSVSPDGRLISHVDAVGGDDHVFVRDLKTGENRCLTKGPGEAGWGVSSVISPDGKQIAYDWALGSNVGDWQELRLIGIDGSSPRVLYRSNDLLSASAEAWSPDGTQILATFLRKNLTYQIALVSVSDGAVRVVTTRALKTVNGRIWGQKVSFSPDGRYIAYEFPPQRDASRDIFLLPTDGGPDIPLVQDPANNRLLDWTPDGKGILFASDRTGKWKAWVMPVADGKPRGSPELANVDIARIRRGLGFTRDGSYYYGVSSWVNDVYIAPFDLTRGSLQSPKKVVRHVGPDTSVEWSPDGKYLAYASGYGHEPDLFVLGIRSVETGKERLLRLNRMVRFGGHSFELHWSPDGRSLLAQGRDKDYMGPGMDSQGLYRIDAETGTFTPIVQATNICPPNCVEWPVWSPKGTVIFVRWIGGYRSIVARESESGREKELYRAPSSARVSRLAISPDGRRVAFVYNSKAGETVLKVVKASGGDAQELLTLPALTGELPLAWTPDSRYIIYAVSTKGEKREFELWRIPADGGEPRKLGLSMEGLLPYGLSVHPDGRRIAFTAGTPLHTEVWVIEHFVPALTTGK